MKKLLKFMGLLLVAGALFMGCQQNVNVDSDSIKLSDGTWDIDGTTSYSYEISSIKYSFSYFTDYTIKVAEKKFTYKKASGGLSASYTVPDSVPDSAMENYKKQVEEMYADEENVTIKVSGKTITVKISESATDEEIAKMNEVEHEAGDFAETFPDGAVIKTNKKKTEYKVTYTIPAENEDDHEAKVVYTFKKK